MDLNDKELFQHAISNEPPAETPAETPAEPAAEVDAGVARDDKGRFAPKEPTEPVQTQPPEQAQPQGQPKPEEAHVPSWRLREVNEAREAAERRAHDALSRATEYERQLAAMRQQQAPKPEPVDPWADLPGALQQNRSEFSQTVSQVRLEARFEQSEMLMRDKLGDEKFNDLRQWGLERSKDPAFEAKIMNSRHPWSEVARLRQQEDVLSKVGGDVDAFRAKILEDALKDQTFLGKAVEAFRGQSRPQTTVQIPPSINRQTSAASPHEEQGDMSDASLFAYAKR